MSRYDAVTLVLAWFSNPWNCNMNTYDRLARLSDYPHRRATHSVPFLWCLLPRRKIHQFLYWHKLKVGRCLCQTKQNDKNCSLLPSGMRTSLEKRTFMGHPCGTQSKKTREQALFCVRWKSYALILAVGHTWTLYLQSDRFK